MESDILAQEIEQAMQYYDWFHNVLPRQELLFLGNLSASPRSVASTQNTRKTPVRIFGAAVTAPVSETKEQNINDEPQQRLLFLVPFIDLLRFYSPSQSVDLNKLLHQLNLPANGENIVQTQQSQTFGRIQLPKQSILLSALGAEQLLQMVPLDSPAQLWSQQVLLPALYGNPNLIVPPKTSSTSEMNQSAAEQARQYQTQVQTLQTFLGPTPTMLKYPGLFGVYQ